MGYEDRTNCAELLVRLPVSIGQAGMVSSKLFGAVLLRCSVYEDHVRYSRTANLLGADVSGGSLKLPTALLELKQNVDSMAVTAGALFNQVSNRDVALGKSECRLRLGCGF